ncbi:FxsA family protein [Sulfurospirillum arcachonense]|uniref:FxsA family protein n=1 Tax=Sulfurospirillum arcachonense TaxID=57666 RepID=UPI00046831BE|nr:FxsA family protein [Sulfurospirillum arcachonense]
MNYFLVYLLLEVFVSVNISSNIGALATFLEIIFSAMVGFILLANFRNTLMESMQAMQKRTISMQEFQKLNAFTLLGALLLIVPGFFSDIIGLFLQFSFFATLFAKKILHVKDNIDIDDIQNIDRTKENNEIIDVEVIDDRTER